MIDYAIFGFGLAVVLIVGSALAILISANNRALERDAGLPSGRAETAGELQRMSKSAT